MNSLDDLLALHPLRPSDGGKDERGSLVIVGGPPTCPGAVLLAGTAALRAGSGRVQALVHPDVAGLVAVASWELFVDGWDLESELPDRAVKLLADADAVVVGPGHAEMDPRVVAAVATAAPQAAIVLDAGGLAGAHGVDPSVNLVLAPNTSEASDLSGRVGDEPDLARALSSMFTRPVAVRGPRTAIADAEETWCYDDAPPGLGTPGSGDVLIGVLAALLAGGMAPAGALGWAVRLHAHAGHMLAASIPVGYLARDLVPLVPHALAELMSPSLG